MNPSDPTIGDIERTGDDLLARIAELTVNQERPFATEFYGWRPLLVACGREIERLRAEENRVVGIARARGRELDTVKEERRLLRESFCAAERAATLRERERCRQIALAYPAVPSEVFVSRGIANAIAVEVEP